MEPRAMEPRAMEPRRTRIRSRNGCRVLWFSAAVPYANTIWRRSWPDPSRAPYTAGCRICRPGRLGSDVYDSDSRRARYRQGHDRQFLVDKRRGRQAGGTRRPHARGCGLHGRVRRIRGEPEAGSRPRANLPTRLWPVSGRRGKTPGSPRGAVPDARGEERRAVVGLFLLSKSTTARVSDCRSCETESVRGGANSERCRKTRSGADWPRRPVRPDVQAGKMPGCRLRRL